MEKVNGATPPLRGEATTASIPSSMQAPITPACATGWNWAPMIICQPFTIDSLYATGHTAQKSMALRRGGSESCRCAITSARAASRNAHALNGILAYGEILTGEAATLQPAEIAEMGQVIYDSGKRLNV
jgi:hypothetical protein